MLLTVQLQLPDYRPTLKNQVVVDKKSQKIICTSFSNGRKLDVRLFKEFKVQVHTKIKILIDSCYQGIHKLHFQAELPKKETHKHPLTKKDKRHNQKIASERAVNENIVGKIKRLKIITDKYRNKPKRFGLRYNLIAGIYNWELKS